MARSKLTEVKDDLITDSGAVLWSIIKGEQLEYPVTLNFIENVCISGFQFEAVVLEASNIVDSIEVPTTVKVGGITTTLTVRTPVWRDTWNPATAYNREDLVYYSGLYYKLASGTARVSATTPDVDPLWEDHPANKLYIQFPSTLGASWSPGPAINYPVYGFFELRVTEPSNPVFVNTWKPIRGLVQILYSPTDVV
jgi:hypothetical protein